MSVVFVYGDIFQTEAKGIINLCSIEQCKNNIIFNEYPETNDVLNRKYIRVGSIKTHFINDKIIINIYYKIKNGRSSDGDNHSLRIKWFKECLIKIFTQIPNLKEIAFPFVKKEYQDILISFSREYDIKIYIHIAEDISSSMNTLQNDENEIYNIPEWKLLHIKTKFFPNEIEKYCGNGKDCPYYSLEHIHKLKEYYKKDNEVRCDICIENEKYNKDIFIEYEEDYTYHSYSLYDYIMNNTPVGWEDFFNETKDEIKFISNEITNSLREGNEIFPKLKDVFNAFSIKPEDIKCILVGMDPYHTPNQANGLCFSIKKGNPIQPSLKNIFKELKNQGFTFNENNGELNKWVEQGVFLINTALTVQKGKPDSHTKLWKKFTKKLFEYLSNITSKKVVILWGKKAQYFNKIFDKEYIKILESPHPSGLSAHKGFFGNNHFLETNKYLLSQNIKEIDWNL